LAVVRTKKLDRQRNKSSRERPRGRRDTTEVGNRTELHRLIDDKDAEMLSRWRSRPQKRSTVSRRGKSHSHLNGRPSSKRGDEVPTLLKSRHLI